MFAISFRVSVSVSETSSVAAINTNYMFPSLQRTLENICICSYLFDPLNIISSTSVRVIELRNDLNADIINFLSLKRFKS